MRFPTSNLILACGFLLSGPASATHELLVGNSPAPERIDENNSYDKDLKKRLRDVVINMRESFGHEVGIT